MEIEHENMAFDIRIGENFFQRFFTGSMGRQMLIKICIKSLRKTQEIYHNVKYRWNRYVI